jgi:hypothetical protein
MEQIREIEVRLKGKSYQDLDKEMAELSTDTLLELLNGKSIKVGDTASSLLNRRNEKERLAQFVLAGKYTTVSGKVRASNTLWFGEANTKKSEEALLYLARDKNVKVAGTALLALVAMKWMHIIPELEKIKEVPGTTDVMKGKIDLAIEALKQGNPKIYAPYYGG